MTEMIRVPPTLKSMGCPEDASPELTVQYRILIRLENIGYELAKMNALKEQELSK